MRQKSTKLSQLGRGDFSKIFEVKRSGGKRTHMAQTVREWLKGSATSI
jgi:hypothetical protein